MNIKVLLYDDQEKFDFVGLAELEGIDVIQFQSAQESIDELKRNPKFYHAVILDAKGILNKGDQKTGLDGLRELRDFLKELNAKLYLPHFIFTGQPDYQTEIWFKQSYGEFFIKGKDEQILLDKIKDSVSKKEEYIIQKKYDNVFVICDEDKLGEECFEKISSLAQSLENHSFTGTSEDLFLPIRKLLEKLFVKLSKIEVIDPELIKQKGWINGSSIFLSDRHTSYESKIDVHPIIQDAIYRLLNIIQDSSHAEGGLRMKVDEYCNKYRSHFLYKSSIYLMFEILSYFNRYIDEHSDLQVNRSMWQKKILPDFIDQDDKNQELKKGIVINLDQQKGFAFFKPDIAGDNIFIPPALVKKNLLENDNKIRVIIEEVLDHRTQEIRKQVKRVET